MYSPTYYITQRECGSAAEGHVHGLYVCRYNRDSPYVPTDKAGAELELEHAARIQGITRGFFQFFFLHFILFFTPTPSPALFPPFLPILAPSLCLHYSPPVFLPLLFHAWFSTRLPRLARGHEVEWIGRDDR